jgi:hypothetical protein
MGNSRQRAISLQAASVYDVLTNAGFGALVPKITAAQLQQLQRYLDAAVVDPVVQQEANAWHRKATKSYGQLVVVDPAIERRADRAMRDYIVTDKFDDRVRLNVSQIIDDAAFKPKTDNPDEADYLDHVRKVLETRGAWLRLSPKLVRDAQDPSRWVFDPRRYDVWLSLGPDGDTIPTRTGRIDRDALIGTVVFGAGYYTAVDHGRVLTTLQREADRLSSEIEDVMTLYFELRRIRDSAAPGVVPVSDLLGGASFPDEDVWQGAHKLLMRALDMRNAGRIYGFQALLGVAALATRNAAQLVSSYRDDTVAGASRAVKGLKVAKAAGEVATLVLTVVGVGAVIRAGTTAAEAAAASEVDALAERTLSRYLAKNPELAGELNQVRVVPGPKGTILGGIKGGHSAGAGTGFHSW